MPLTQDGGTAVIQPLPGIGDMVWHLAHIRALAARFGGAVTLVAKPRSAADQIFTAEDTVRDVLWMERNPEGRRGCMTVSRASFGSWRHCGRGGSNGS